MKQPYPGYNVLDQLPHWDSHTRRVILDRIHAIPPLTFFRQPEADLLAAVAARIMPQSDRAPADQIPIVPFLDQILARDDTPGFREPDMPWPQEMWRAGLAGIDEASHSAYGRGFCHVAAAEQDSVLASIQDGHPAGPTWQRLPAPKFFKHLVAQIAAIYYAHPAAWSEIGWAGPASPRGYVRLGYDMRDPWEAEERADPSSAAIIRQRSSSGAAGADEGEATH